MTQSTKNIGMQAWQDSRAGLWHWGYVNGCPDLSSRGYGSKSAAQRASNEAMRNTQALEAYERAHHPAYK